MYKATYSINGVDYVRVSRRAAVKAFCDGVIVKVAPRDIRPDSVWCGFCDFQFTQGIADFYSNPMDAFDRLENNFDFYNGKGRFYLPLDGISKYTDMYN